MAGYKAGEIIYRSNPYVYILDKSMRGLRCDYCFSKQSRLKRCSQCSYLYFCNQNCQLKSWDLHKSECKLIKNASQKQLPGFVWLTSRIILKLKKFGVEEPCEIIGDHKMNFHRLLSHTEEIKKKDEEKILTLYVTLKSFFGEINIPALSEITEIFGKICVNTFSILDDERQTIGCGIYLGASIFDHSCDPTAEIVFNGTELTVRAIKDIAHKDVTQIYISYLEELQLKQDRQEYLQQHYFFTCQCLKCTLPDYETLLTKTLIDQHNCESKIKEYREKVLQIKQMKKEKAPASKIYDVCMQELVKQEGILGDTHICRIKILEFLFDACIDSSQWAEAVTIGKQLIEPYRVLYGKYHSTLGIHLFKVGKIQNFQGLTQSAEKNLLEAEAVLKVTHGTEHPLYKSLIDVLLECQASAAIENL